MLPEEIRKRILFRLDRELKKNPESVFWGLRDVTAAEGIDWPKATTEAQYLKDEGLLTINDAWLIKLTHEGIQFCEMKSESYGVPDFYKEAIPRKQKERQKFLSKLNDQLAKEEPGGRQYVLLKEKIDQVKDANTQDDKNRTRLIAIGALIISVGALLINLLKKG